MSEALYRKGQTGSVSPRRERFAAEVVERAQILDEEIKVGLREAFAAVKRECFLARRYHVRVMDDIALPIGFDQCVLQPSHLARMMSLIGVRKGLRVLELGTGSGYSAALMASAGAYVYSLERIGLLAQQTRKVLDKLTYGNVLVRSADARKGWLEHAPFDAILSWVAFPELPPKLSSQVVPDGGRLLFPVGPKGEQRLTLFETRGGELSSYRLERSEFSYAD